MSASQELFNKHLTLAEVQAKATYRRMPRSVAFDELHNDALIGLWKAATRYNHQRNTQFPTYAIPCIRGAMLDGLRQRDWATRDHRQHSNVCVAHLNGTVQDGLVSPPLMDPLEQEDFWQRVSTGLSRTERIVIIKWLRDGCSHAEIADYFALSESRVSQLAIQAKRVLQKRLDILELLPGPLHRE